ncbi:MAG: glutaredoxin family protein [Gammaproteobacteria bacterium]|nr:glutaredoxin family protein [Gammaproteobacteria bacterium]
MSLILYTRHGCHLCEDFEQELRRLQQEQPFDFAIRDVDARPEWRAAYNDRVPLLLAGDVEIARYFLDPQALRGYLTKHRMFP